MQHSSPATVTGRNGVCLSMAARQVLAGCRRVLTVRGETNRPLPALEIVHRIVRLTDEHGARFFDRLTNEVSPDPLAVLDAAGGAVSPPQWRARPGSGSRVSAACASGIGCSR